MSSLILFENKELGQVRIIKDKNNEPLFCLKDICDVLELSNISVVKEAISREFDKGGKFNLTPLETNGGMQNFIVINESELYFVLMRSDKPKAKPFRQWVIKEVLPSIRKQGYYSFDDTSKLGNYSKYNLPDTPYKEKITKAIEEAEKRQNSKFIELIEYEIVEKFKNGKIEISQKLNFKTKLI